MMNRWVYKKLLGKGRVGNFGRSWRNCHSATQVYGNSKIQAPSEKSDFRAEFSTIPPSFPSKGEFHKLKS